MTDSRDPKHYVKKMRQRDELLNSNWGTICTPFEMTALDGRKRKINCINTAGAFRTLVKNCFQGQLFTFRKKGEKRVKIR